MFFLHLQCQIALIVLPVFPQEAEPYEISEEFADEISNEAFQALPEPYPETGLAPDPNAVYVISSIEFFITGRTLPYSLMRKAELSEGEEITGTEDLEKFIRNKTRILVNERVLAEAEIDYTVGEPGEDGKYPVTLLVTTKDTTNIIAIPSPKYSSNTGLEFKLIAMDNNFLGSMDTLRFDIGYVYDEKKRNILVIELSLDYPFRAFGYDWNFDFINTFNYRPNEEEQFYNENAIGISMKLPFRRTTFTFGFREHFTVNDENNENDVNYKVTDGTYQSGLYMSSVLFSSWKIPTGLNVSDYGELTWTPRISATFPHELPQWSLADYRKGPVLEQGHSLGFNKIDWIGNFRRGFDISLNNSYTYNFYRRPDWHAFYVTYSIEGKGFFVVSEFLGISSYLKFRHTVYPDSGYYDYAGDALRGILDKAVNAKYMLSLNLDFPLRALRFTPSKWFNSPRARFFDFEMHISPIIDLALYHDHFTNTSFSFHNLLFTGGLEFIVFLESFRSTYIRASFGVNAREYLKKMSKIPSGDNREIYIGIGHYY